MFYINVLSLFDGISCGRVALERAGIKIDTYYASEIDKYAIEISRKNYPDIIQLGDIKKWKYWDLPKIDLLIGGSPCQGFSFAGKGLNFDDPRSKLFFEYVDVLKYFNPKYFLLENVKMKKEHQDIISNHLGVEPIEINSSLLSSQNRVRLYWTNISNIEQPKDKGLLLKDILDNNIHNHNKLSEVTANRNRTIKNTRSKNDKSFSLTATMYKGSQTNGMTVIDEGDYKRCLTPIECERLQTLPDQYTEGVSNTQRYKMLGNGWTVDVIAHIFRYIK